LYFIGLARESSDAERFWKGERKQMEALRRYLPATMAGLLMLLLVGLGLPGTGRAAVHGGFGVTIALPPLAFQSAPPVVPVPDSNVYFVPSVSADIFFYNGGWYRPYEGQWFMAPSYRGPWSHIRRVPREVVVIPHTRFREYARGFQPIPHEQLARNWRGWEREHHWYRDRYHGGMMDRHERAERGEHRG
jgi:hypothetical protein